jgi:hypothetical protein
LPKSLKIPSIRDCEFLYLSGKFGRTKIGGWDVIIALFGLPFGSKRARQTALCLSVAFRFETALNLYYRLGSRRCLTWPRKREQNKVSNRKLSVRDARMELVFAMVKRDKHEIATAQARLDEALGEREKRRREPQTKRNGFSKAP